MTDIDFAHRRFTGNLAYRENAEHIDLRGADIDGAVRFSDIAADTIYAWALETGLNVDLCRSNVSGDVNLRDSTIGYAVAGWDTEIGGDLDLRHVDAHHITVPRSTIKGTMYLEHTDAEYINLADATVDTLHVEDIDRYELRVTDDTRIDTVQEGVYGIEDRPSLTDTEHTLLSKIIEKDLVYTDRGGSLFRYDELKQDICMDDVYRGAFANLVKKDAITVVDDDFYVAKSDYL